MILQYAIGGLVFFFAGMLVEWLGYRRGYQAHRREELWAKLAEEYYHTGGRMKTFTAKKPIVKGQMVYLGEDVE